MKKIYFLAGTGFSFAALTDNSVKSMFIVGLTIFVVVCIGITMLDKRERENDKKKGE